MNNVSREQVRNLLNYNRFFYNVQRGRSGASAHEVVGLVNSMLSPASVVDVGCGIGAWLSEWRRQGVTDVLGIDGDWVDRALLQIPAEQFTPHDLTVPFDSDRPYDLAISLEVAEHIEPEHGPALVDLLVSLAPVVLFSAAIPNQGGQHHVNERWQGDWARDFADRGYVAVDAVRPQIWENKNVAVWYRQNIVLYVKQDVLAGRPELQALVDRWGNRPVSMVHPDLYSTMFLKAASGYVRQFRGIKPTTLLRAAVHR